MTRHNVLTVVGAAAASCSAGALALHALGLLPMYFFIDVVAAPAMVVLLAAGVLAKRIHETVFVQRVLGGVCIGLIATGCYDAVRYAIQSTGLVGFDVFFSHPVYGKLITGQPETSRSAIVVGWGYHVWNGVTLAIMYTLVAGPARWFYAVGWALFLEAAWLVTLPSVLASGLSSDVIAVSIIGHTAYGATLGVLSQRWIEA